MSAALTLTSHASLPSMSGAFSRTFRELYTQYLTAWRLFISAALGSRASLPPMLEALNRRIRKPILSRMYSKLCSVVAEEFNSNTS